MTIATSKSWKTQPLPDQNEIIDYNRTFTNDELLKIKYGFIPQGMENKWFIYFRKNVLYMHRSWSGHCIFQLTFFANSVIETKVNRKKDEYNSLSVENDIDTINQVINSSLIKNNTPLPKRWWQIWR